MSPFSLMRRLMEDMGRLFEEIAGMSGQPQRGGGLAQALWSPQVQVFEQDGQLVVRADLPGLMLDEIRVEVVGDTLLIEGERRSEGEERQGQARPSERGYKIFRRAIPLPEGIDAESVEARFEAGVLEVRLGLPQARQRGKRIEVKGGGWSQPQKSSEAQGQTPDLH